MSDIPGFRLNSNSVDHVDALHVGARLAEFEIVGLLGVGGFGMVYQAFDHSLLRFVAIKEYMPASLAGRMHARSIWVRSSSDEQSFQAGLASFVDEARLLAQFDHPSLVKVFRFWEANHTAYMVMPLYAGRTLKQARAQMRTPPSEAWLRKVIWSVCGALRVLHDGKTLHRDISPDNIFLQDSGPPVLLDLGAARFAIGDQDHKHTAVLKVNYAPIEQYADSDSELKPGPWSDLYSLAAVIYGCICNDAPLPSTLRSIRDRMVPFGRVAKTVRTQFGVEYSAPFVETIHKALSLQPRDRHWTVDAFLEQMGLTSAPANLEKFDFRAELGDNWVATKTDGSPSSALLDLSDVSVPLEGMLELPVAAPGAEGKAPGTGKVRNTDNEKTVLHIPVPASSRQAQSRAAAEVDFQDTVVRDMDFEDSRDEPFEAVVAAEAAAARNPAHAGTEAAGAVAAAPVNLKPSARNRASSSKKPTGARRVSGKSARQVLVISAAMVVLAAGAATWFMSSSTPPPPPPAPVEQAFVPTPDEEILTEMSESAREAQLAASAAAEAAASAATAASAAAASAAAQALAVPKDQKPRVAPVRKPVETPSAAHEAEPAPAPAPTPASRPASVSSAAQVKRVSPEDACANAGFLAKPMCIHNECQKPGMESQSICVENKRRREEERRQRQMYSQ